MSLIISLSATFNIGVEKNVYAASSAVFKDFSTRGYGHYAILKQDNTLWMYGRNDHGQLGIKTNPNAPRRVRKVMDNVKKISTGDLSSAAIKQDDSLWMWGDNRHGQLGDGTRSLRITPIKIMDGVESVCLGGDHSVAIKKDGSLWVWGLESAVH